MGKLRFTLTYVLFWLVIILSCLLAENFAFFSRDHIGGMGLDSSFIISIAVIILLVIYYFTEHQKNGLKFDKILLPILVIYTAVSIATVCWQGPRTFVNPDDGVTTTIAISPIQKFAFSLQLVVWAAFIYALVFVGNRYAISRKWLRWVGILFVCGMIVATLVDVVMEFRSIIAIFTSTYTGPGLQFIIYNSNVWGHLVLVALLSCVVLNIKKFHLFYYISMVHFFIIITFTTSATSFFVGLVATIVYSLYEIIHHLKKSHKKLAMALSIYLGSLATFAGLLALLVIVNVPAAVNFWSFISGQILQKDYATLTSRTDIWAAVFHLVSRSPLDMIFGLGYRSGNLVFTQYYLAMRNHGFAVQSTHNAFFEILLRHGIIGLISYLGVIGLFGFGIVKMFKKKQYRVACLYTLCFCGLLVHGVAESTLFMAANTSSVYMTLVFYIPVINAVQDKKFKELNEDLQQTEVVEKKPVKNDIVYTVQTLLLGLFMAFAASIALAHVYRNLALLIVYICVASVSLVAYLVTPIFVNVVFSKEKDSLKSTFKNYVANPLVNNAIALAFVGASTLGFAFLMSFVLSFNVLTVLLFTFVSVVSYLAMAWSLAKPANKAVENYLDAFLLGKLKRISAEVENG